MIIIYAVNADSILDNTTRNTSAVYWTVNLFGQRNPQKLNKVYQKRSQNCPMYESFSVFFIFKKVQI